MRDPQRIRPVINRLTQVWECFPQLRLGQLLSNLTDVDLYNIEDDELINKVESFYYDELVRGEWLDGDKK